jgi:putative phosphoesterase
MMRIGILSDTHDHVRRTARAVALLLAEGAEVLIHCGDLTGPEIVAECGVVPSYYVFGNNDFDEDALRAAMTAVGGVCLERGGEIVLSGRRIAVTHGDSAKHFRRLLAARPDYLLFGHTHLKLNERDGPIRQINPGALHRAPEWTVATLDLVADDLRFWTVD